MKQVQRALRWRGEGGVDRTPHQTNFLSERGFRGARLLLGVVMLAAIPAATSGAAFTPVLIKGHPAHPTRILAKVATGSTLETHATTLAAHRLTAVRDYPLVPGLVLFEVETSTAAMSTRTQPTASSSVPAVESLLEKIAALRRSGLYEYVEPDYIVQPDRVPTDSSFTNGTLWGLRNTGQNFGTAGVDIDAVRAWDVTTGSSDVIVAVIDSGIRYTHQDLSVNMWRNSGEIAGNGIDDDGNSYVDDVYGINAVTGSGDPMDDVGHGTHIAGTIGAVANNAGSHVGVAWSVRLMACKFFDNNDGGTFSDLLECYDYAVAHGAKILNCSFGSEHPSLSERLALESARDRGVLVVAAAGNDGRSNDTAPHYPSSYDLANVIAVAAIDRSGQRATFSNHGLRSVDLGAPGTEISSTYHTSDASYFVAQGTSMAAPHVAGVAALVRARFPNISVWDLSDRLVQTATATSSLQGITVSGGRVNAYQALAASGDGQLKLIITPASGTTFFHGRTTSISVRVRDLVGVTGATVSGTISSGGTLAFQDDGVTPDVVAGDGNYTAALIIPSSGSQLTLSVGASAPGKLGGSASATYTLAAPPLNDDFAHRATIAFTNGSVTGTNVGATLELGEPTLAGELGGASVWWTWTAPENATVTVTTVGSNFDTLLGVFTGSSVNALTEIGSNDDIDGPNQPSKVTFSAAAGTQYQIVVDGWEGKTGNITLNVQAAIPPPNDNFANRITLTGDSFSTVGSHRNATREAGEPSHVSGETDGGSVWFTWTAPATGTAKLATTPAGGSYPSNVLAVYEGSSLVELVRVPGRGDDTRYSSWARTTFGAVAGTTYQIAVAFNSQAGDFALNLSMTASPANDRFANRFQVSGTTITTTGSNVDATREPGEPQHHPNAFGASVWWTWTAPTNGTAVITTYGSGGGTVLALYTGTNLESLNLVSANNRSPALYSGPSRVAFSAVAGTAYQIAVDSDGGTIPLTLNITLVDPPPNDQFANRAIVTGTSTTLAGNLLGATLETGEPAASRSSSLGTSVWFSWTAPATGTAYVIANNFVNPLVSVYTGDSVAALSSVTNSATWDTTSRVVFHAKVGVSYQICVDAGSVQAEGAFVVDLTLLGAPANDMFADRATLTGASALVTATPANATIEAGEPHQNMSGYGGSSVWWTWTAPGNGSVILQVTGSSSSSVALNVFSGSALGSLVPVSTQAEFASGSRTYMFSSIAGTTYQIAASASYGPATEFMLNVELVTPPANDLFANRTVLSGTSIDLAVTTRGATREDSEPYLGSDVTATVWWQWTAPANGTAVITSAGMLENIVVGVYTGTGLSSLTSVGSIVYWEPSRSVAFRAVAGTAYQIVVGRRFASISELPLTLSLYDPPPNDLFANATTIAGDAIEVSGSNNGALRESLEPAHGYEHSTNNGSIWWRWTPSASGTAVVTTDGSAIATSVGVYTGASLNSLMQVVAGTGESGAGGRLLFSVNGGTTYWIAVQGRSGARGLIALQLTRYSPPANDGFGSGAMLSGGTAEVSGYTYGASAEPGEPVVAGYYNTNSVWWTWTAPASGRVVLIVTSPEVEALVGVFSGSTLATLTQVPQSGYSGVRGRIAFNATAGATYHIAVASPHFTYGNFDLSLLLVDPPPNDDFANRSIISGATAAVTGSNLGAVSELGEGYHDGSHGPTATVWWTWTAPAGGPVIVSTLASDIDALVTVYTGAGLSQLRRVIGAQGRVVFNAVAGTAYQMVVDGVNGAMGAIALEIVQGKYAYGWVGTDAGTIAAGSTITLSANVTEGTGPFTYQWLYNGTPIEGATSDTLVIPSIQRYHSTAGFRVRVSNLFGTYESGSYWPIVEAPATSNSRLLNLSTRALGLAGEHALIPGFVITGTGTRRVLLRAVGPQLADFGVGGAMPDPQMTLRHLVGDTSTVLATNNDWGLDGNPAEIAARAELIGAFPLTSGGKDAALLLELAPGSYTVTAEDAGGAPGVAMVELYDATTASDSSAIGTRLVNLSNRGYVGTGADVMIPGFVVSQEGPTTVLLRAVGPGLSEFGVTGVLADPKLTVYRAHPETGATELILGNDNWGANGDAAEVAATAGQVGAFALAPSSKDAAFVITLLPGVYTVHASGADGGTGVALVELYVVE